MSTLILQHVGQKDGVDVYAPIEPDDAKLINGQNVIVCEKKSEKARRTALQNRALHKYCSLLADALNNAGYDMRKTLTKQAEIPWSGGTIKEHLWKPIQEAVYNKGSTTELETNEVSAVYDVLNRHTAAKLGVSVAFPSNRYQDGS